MYAMIEKYLNSGVTQKVFCKAENLAYSTFSYWPACAMHADRLKKYHTYNQATPPISDFVQIKLIRFL